MYVKKKKKKKDHCVDLFSEARVKLVALKTSQTGLLRSEVNSWAVWALRKGMF